MAEMDRKYRVVDSVASWCRGEFCRGVRFGCVGGVSLGGGDGGRGAGGRWCGGGSSSLWRGFRYVGGVRGRGLRRCRGC